MRAATKMGLATLAFAVLHSAMATRTAKHLAGTLLGNERRDAGYRVFFVAQSLLSFSALLVYGAKLPTRSLYRVKGAPAVILRLGQAAGVGQLLAGLRQVGFLRWSGIQNFYAWRVGLPVPAGPVAQGPEMTEDGKLSDGSVFRWTRHPLNFAGIPILWLTPHMTARRLVFNILSSIYLVFGSRHEEARLSNAYGTDYQGYLNKRVPFFWPSAGKGLNYKVLNNS
jgi:methanethiol S-methyltransferase